MVFKIHSDTSYLFSEAKAHSHADGHFYLGNKPSNTPEENNGALRPTHQIHHHETRHVLLGS
jgi:hypothetical protein